MRLGKIQINGIVNINRMESSSFMSSLAYSSLEPTRSIWTGEEARIVGAFITMLHFQIPVSQSAFALHAAHEARARWSFKKSAMREASARQRRGNRQRVEEPLLPTSSHTHERKKKKRKSNTDDDVPFYVIFLWTALVVGLLFAGTFLLYRYFDPVPDSIIDDDDVGLQPEIHEEERDKDKIRLDVMEDAVASTVAPTPRPLPTWNLTDGHDAFDLARKLEPKSSSSNHLFWQIARGLRNTFAEKYGGENAARAILQRGLSTFSVKNSEELPSDLVWTACRIQKARKQKRQFRFAFGGYSVTLGRGNYFKQSFPLAMEKLLATAFSSLKAPLLVKNAAVGGCPSFPYGFCTPNFWGSNADVVSWDFSMNEAGGDARGLEHYIRRVAGPKLIVKDTHLAEARRDLLSQYIDVLHDPLVIHTDPAVRPFLDGWSEEHRPEGFQEWRTFGAPLGSPGQVSHHPGVKEHEFIAWLLTMHFLRALEVVAASDDDPHLLTCPEDVKESLLPPPMLKENLNSTKPYSSLLVGHPRPGQNSWVMNPVQCRTTFEPIVQGKLQSIRVSGTTAEDLDVMLPKSKMYYNQGWVLDLSEGEKQAKRKLDVFGGLGFKDSKKAYYGIYTSGPLRLLLPYESKKKEDQPKAGDAAKDWLESVTFCQVNEKRSDSTCTIVKDIHFEIDGRQVQPITLDAPGTQYLGQDLCVYIKVPSQANLTTRGSLKSKSAPLGVVFPDNNDAPDLENQVGLAVAIRVNNTHIVQRQQACSISHVIWEQRSR